VALALGLCVSVIGCVRGDDAPDDAPAEGDLRALLDDGELTELVSRKLTVDGGAASMPAPPPADAAAGGAGGGVPVPGPIGTAGAGGGPRRDAAAPDAAAPCFDGTGGRGGGRDAGFGFCERPGPLASWNFEDCNPERTELRSPTFQFPAFRTVGAACVDGREGQGISLPRPQDMVYAPDQPAFTFDRGVTVAAWVNPSRLGGQRTLFRKREGSTSSFALMLVDRRFVFVIDRTGRTPASVSAPARAGAWVHVAATYDGERLRLYLDGREAASVVARGTIAPGEGPLLMGNDADRRRVEGALDNFWFDTRAASADTILGLTCVRRPPRLSVRPQAGPAVAAGTPVTYDFALTNDDPPSCGRGDFFLVSNTFQPEFSVDPSFSFLNVGSGETQTVPVTITSSGDAEPDTYHFDFFATGADRFSQPGASASVTYTVASGGCRISTRRELLVRDVSVVDDPVRTTFTAPAANGSRGKWTFARLLRELAPRPEDAPALAESVFGAFTQPSTVNGFTAAARPGMQPTVLDAWPRVGGQLDLERAPLRLLAIVNRIDLRNLAEGNAGEGRFVFGVHDRFGSPLEFTVILEYKLPARTEADVIAWANDWHALGALPFPSEAYNAALEALTDRFVRRGAMPGRPNGSALAALRTNEIALAFPWELREFTLNAAGRLVPSPVLLTPDLSFDGSPDLAEWVNANEAAILGETHVVPATLKGRPFLAGAVFNELQGWRGDGIRNPEARHKFSLNTCNGCHSAQETNTFFLHIGNRFPGEESFLSSFLTGTTVFDPVTFEPRRLNDLGRRNRDLATLVCPADQLPPPPPSTPTPTPLPPRADGGAPVRSPSATTATAPAPAPTVSKGIRRVH
jgi:hypothetical protein